MGDIETLGKHPGCVILSIGAAVFDPRGESVLNTFYEKISLFDSLMHGFEIDQSTVDWWKTQNENAKNEFSQPQSHQPLPVKYVLEEFAQWFLDNEGAQFWCQGATFDAPILQAYYER
ncbi:MAG: hypothetical protein DI598_20830, partial [Pseudopedobacter saltans]